MSKHRRRRRRRGKIADSTPAVPGDTSGADSSAGTSEVDVSESTEGSGGGDD